MKNIILFILFISFANTLFASELDFTRDELEKKWKKILVEFSDRFVFATDYGGGRKPLDEYLTKKVNNFNNIIKDLPNEAKHKIAYKNAWYLLTGKNWK